MVVDWANSRSWDETAATLDTFGVSAGQGLMETLDAFRKGAGFMD